MRMAEGGPVTRDEKPHVTIYTDGGADPNPGPGGWGAVLIHDATGRIKEFSGSVPDSTNNRMEQTAAIRALEALKQPCEVELYSDSAYLVQGMTRWVDKWAGDGWVRGKRKKPVENADLWQRLLELRDQHDITWRWLKGHAGDVYNERVDELASREIRLYYEQHQLMHPADAEAYLIVSAKSKQGFWAALVRHDNEEELLTGREQGVTSNQLDILAAANALAVLPEGIHVNIYSMSDYLRNGASQWIINWKKRGWQTKGGDPVKNREQWEWLDDEMSVREVDWPSIKGDETYNLIFEDIGRRAQEVIEEEMRAEQGDLYMDQTGGAASADNFYNDDM